MTKIVLKQPCETQVGDIVKKRPKDHVLEIKKSQFPVDLRFGEVERGLLLFNVLPSRAYALDVFDGDENNLLHISSARTGSEQTSMFSASNTKGVFRIETSTYNYKVQWGRRLKKEKIDV